MSKGGSTNQRKLFVNFSTTMNVKRRLNKPTKANASGTIHSLLINVFKLVLPSINFLFKKKLANCSSSLNLINTITFKVNQFLIDSNIMKPHSTASTSMYSSVHAPLISIYVKIKLKPPKHFFNKLRLV